MTVKSCCRIEIRAFVDPGMLRRDRLLRRVALSRLSTLARVSAAGCAVTVASACAASSAATFASRLLHCASNGKRRASSAWSRRALSASLDALACTASLSSRSCLTMASRLAQRASSSDQAAGSTNIGSLALFSMSEAVFVGGRSTLLIASSATRRRDEARAR